MSRFVLAAAAVVGLATALPAAAQFQKPEDAVKYRKAAFTLMGTHFGRLAAVAQGKAPYDPAAAIVNADLVSTISHLPYAGFVEGTSGTEKGTPKANVWTERAKFDEGAKKLQEETAKLASAAKTNNLDQLKAAVDSVGKVCKACHDDFRNK
jgi:cytochrome c556